MEKSFILRKLGFRASCPDTPGLNPGYSGPLGRSLRALNPNYPDTDCFEASISILLCTQFHSKTILLFRQWVENIEMIRRDSEGKRGAMIPVCRGRRMSPLLTLLRESCVLAIAPAKNPWAAAVKFLQLVPHVSLGVLPT